MTVTVGSFSFPNLTAQPFGYQETDTISGFTARKWLISGLLLPSEWLDLLDAYDTWRDTRINDAPTETSGVVGTTINFSGTGPGGEIWTNIACWFIAAPSGQQSGAFIAASIEIIDANEQLDVILLQKEQQAQVEEDIVDLGTITIGTTVLTLLKQPDSYATTPGMELTATGVHYITGNKVPYKIKDVEGTTNLTGWNNIRTWYEAQISTTPSPGSYFPVSSPSATAANKVVDGVVTVQYTVTIQLGYVI